MPCPDIDTDVRWGYSHTKGWIFGYKLDLTCITGELVVHLSADITTANVQDNQMYVPLISSFVFSLPFVLYVIADPGYNAKKLYQYGKKTLKIDLFCPVKRYKVLPKKRLDLTCLYESEIG